MKRHLYQTAFIILPLLLSVPCLAAINAEEAISNPTVLAQLEDQARQAKPKEQCFLYTELVHVKIEIAGKQIVDGDTEKASETLKQVEHYAELIHLGLAKDTKKLREAEILMHSATRHFSEFLHLVSSEDKTEMQATLRHLNKVNEEILTQVFQH